MRSNWFKEGFWITVPVVLVLAVLLAIGYVVWRLPGSTSVLQKVQERLIACSITWGGLFALAGLGGLINVIVQSVRRRVYMKRQADDPNSLSTWCDDGGGR